MLGYSLLLTVGLVLSSPWWMLRMLTTARYREGLRERLGRVPAALAATVAGRRVVWVHAVSVGEVLAASRLVGELEAALGAGWVVVVSTTTRTGQALARERFGVERVFYYPLDFAFAVRPFMRALQPAVLVLIESEVWPRILHECRKAGTPVIVVNARVSDRSFRRSRWVRWIWSRVLRMATLWLAQSEEDARRLVAMGAPQERVRVGGNLKYDVRAPKVSRVAELIKEAAAGRPIIVAGSTVDSGNEHPDENQLVIQAWWGKLREQRTLLILAPRHPEYFGLAYSVAMESPTLLATELLAGKRGMDARSGHLREGETKEVEIIVLDTIGDLAAVYGIAYVAFVGGSLIKRGGHNPLEPAQFGVPVVMGPSFENFRDIVEKMQAVEGIAILGKETDLSTAAAKNAASGRDDSGLLVEELESELVRLLTNRDAAKAMGERGRQVFEEQQGATARAVEAIVAMVMR